MVGKVSAQQPPQRHNAWTADSTAARSVAAEGMDQASASSDSDDDGLKLKVKLDPDEKKKKSKVGALVSSDDEEANEDLSLKIVEKHLLMHAAKLVQNDDDDDNNDVVLDGQKVDLSSSSLLESEIVTAGSSRINDETVIDDKKSDNKRIKVKKKKKKIEKMENGGQSVIAKEVHVETVENGEEAVKASDISDNIVLRKLLRGPRYFDPPDSGWQTCYNCGEEGHMAVNCSSALKRKKPCFICGSFDHGVKQCSKAQDCFICKTAGHRAKDCPEKYKSNSQNAKVCLKCGDYGHDMFSCRNIYPLDDLKEIQCYVCKSHGHLCCVDVTDTSSTKVSCFKCGLSGHTGLACTTLRGETMDAASASSCFKCGREGHFARECTSSAKIRKKNFDSSTPTLRPHRENKDYLGYRSAPNDRSKGHKREKTQNEDSGFTTPQKSRQRGGWITEDPGDFSYSKTKRSRWNSPATPTGRGHKICAVSAVGHISRSQSSRKKSVHHRHAMSRFDNYGNDGFRSYDWW